MNNPRLDHIIYSLPKKYWKCMFEYRDISKILTCFHFSSFCSRHSWPEEDEGWIGKDHCHFYQLQQQRLSFRHRAVVASLCTRVGKRCFFFLVNGVLLCVCGSERKKTATDIWHFFYFFSPSLCLYSRSSHPCTLTFACEKPKKKTPTRCRF